MTTRSSVCKQEEHGACRALKKDWIRYRLLPGYADLPITEWETCQCECHDS